MPKPPNRPEATPRTAVPASTKPIDGANAASDAPAAYSSVAASRSVPGRTRRRIRLLNDSMATAAVGPAASVAPNSAVPPRSVAMTGSTVLYAMPRIAAPNSAARSARRKAPRRPPRTARSETRSAEPSEAMQVVLADEVADADHDNPRCSRRARSTSAESDTSSSIARCFTARTSDGGR